MPRFRFELAGPADDGDLRRILAEPMGGRIAVAFRREPSFFAAAAVDGRFRQVIACRDLETGQLIGFGVRSVLDRYVNGRPAPVGYLSSLRLLKAYRNLGLIARGYAELRRQHADGRAAFYLTTIIEGNAPALRALLGGRAGLPVYHPAGMFHTLVLPLPQHARSLQLRFRRAPPAPPGLELRPARQEDSAAILEFLHREGPRRQFFPCYREDDLFQPGGLLRDLRPADVWLAWQGGRLVGILGAWDQHAFKQSVVCGYSPALVWARPLYNAWVKLTGRAPLPPPGQPLTYRSVALAVVRGDDPTVFAALLGAVRAACGGAAGHLLVGLHGDDPLLAHPALARATRYSAGLYLACWEDGEKARLEVDRRPPYLELGCL
jgi:hypothetical protein